MLRKVTQTDLPQLAAWRSKVHGCTETQALAWLQNVAGLDNLFLLEKQQDGVATPQALLGAVPVSYGWRKGIWVCGAQSAPPPATGPDPGALLLQTCLRAFAAKGYEFAVAVPETPAWGKSLNQVGFKSAFPLRLVRKPIQRNLWAQAEFDNMTVRRLQEARSRYQPGCVMLPQLCMDEMVSQMYARGMTLISTRRGYGLYYQKGGTLQFVELQADNDHSAEQLLQAAREKTGAENAQLLLAENQTIYLGEGKRCPYGMLYFLDKPFPVADMYFRILL